MGIAQYEELVVALLDGVHEAPPWRTFLDRLAAVTGADNASLCLRPQHRRLDEAILLASGDRSPEFLLEANMTLVGSGCPTAHDLPAEGQPYSLDELYRNSPGQGASVQEAVASVHGITVIRQMRIREPSGVDAWLSIVRDKGRFAPGADRILRAVAPVLRGALRSFVVLERERFAATMASDGMRRLRFGWFTLDRDGRVLQSDATADEIFTDSEWLHKDMRGRISALKPEADQEIYRCLGRLAERPNERARAIALCREPWTDLMLLPARSWRIGDPKATALCYVHRDELPSADRCAQLADLFGLAPHEARMALCLSRGMTIAEAAEQQNLTIGSGRMYTKAIYAKTGARGLPDLLRIISRSILAISM